MLKPSRIAASIALIAFLGVAAVAAVDYFEPKKEGAVEEAKNKGEIDAINILASERVAYYTKVLAIFTGALSGFGLLQIFFLTRADQAAAQSSRTAEIMAGAAKSQAARMQTWANIAEMQMNIADKQHALAQSQFIATHRPRLRVRRFMPHLTAGSPVRVSFIIVNVGATAAQIRRFEISFGLRSSEGLNFDPPIKPLDLRKLEGGEAALFIAIAELDYADDWAIADNIPGSSFEVRGEIEYADDLGIIRRTGFWRIRDLGARMAKRDDPYGDWEYED